MLGALFATILVTFPAEGQKLPPTVRTYVIGAVEPHDAVAKSLRDRLYLNGVELDVYRTGAFLAMVKTQPGTNTLTFTQGDDMLVRRFTVAAPSSTKAAEGKPSTHDPYADLGIPTNATFAAKPPRGTPPQRIHVMVDAGHGGSDSGALSPRGLKEKDFNIFQAKAVESALKRAGFKVTMTRTDDSFPALYDRPRRAFREKADVFISIHHNATGAGSNPREVRHSVTYASNEKGLALARAIQKHVAQAVAPVHDNGAQIKSLAVCRNPAVPSCLVEVDFINLPEGEEAAADPARREQVASAIVLGLLDWLAE